MNSSHRPRNDHLESFRSLVKQQDPESNHSIQFKEKASQSRLGISPATPKPNLQQLENGRKRRKGEVEWISEAYRIHQHVSSLLQFMSSIRKPYLNLSNRPITSNSNQNEDGSEAASSSVDLSRKYLKVKHLDDKQRDEIDFQGRMVIKRCMDRVTELEKAEAVRIRTSSSSPSSTLSYLLSSLSSTPQSHHLYSSQLATHRQAITRYLSTMLAEASTKQRDLQEKRLKAKKEKSRSLANERNELSTKINNSGIKSNLQIYKGSINGLSSSSSTSTNKNFNPDEDPTSTSTSLGLPTTELTSLQIQQFESESSALLKSLEQDLDQVKKAESKLMEISQMQTQLIQHLNEQTELTSRLHDEAIENTSEVLQGNEQLKEAKRRNREANKMLSVFLVGSGLGLLFLHWMD